MWSAGVIMYGLLPGGLPFGEEIHTCERYKGFKKWVSSGGGGGGGGGICADAKVEYPPWLFANTALSPVLGNSHSHSHGTSLAHARALIVSLLHPDASLRPSASAAIKHAWLACLSVGGRPPSTLSHAIFHPH